MLKMTQATIKRFAVPMRRLATTSCLRQTPSNKLSVDQRYKTIVGNRDVVGYGINGSTIYTDNVMFPFPAIRFKKNDPDIMALKEKEKGDWKNLTIEEKKQLYRASFCQTFAEMQAPTGEFKSVIGFALMFVCIAALGHMCLGYFIYGPLPESFSEESREAQLRRMIDLRMEHITGVSSKWDYEKDDWKSN